MDFERGKNPKHNLDVGNMHIAREWLKEQNISPSNIESVMEGNNEIIYIDVEGDVWLDDYNLEDVAKIPFFIKFRNVTGKFILGNKKLLL